MELQKVIQGIADNNNQQTFKEISHNKLIRNKTTTLNSLFEGKYD